MAVSEGDLMATRCWIPFHSTFFSHATLFLGSNVVHKCSVKKGTVLIAQGEERFRG